MGADRFAYGVVAALIGLGCGYLLASARSAALLSTYREIIRVNQEHNAEAMQNRRSERDDEAN